MNNLDNLFPSIKWNIENLIEDEEGNIPSKKLLMLGTMVVILGSILVSDIFAAHRSHSSHRSHTSHTSHKSHSSGTHGNHSSHESHVSHISHTSHSNTGSHSNSKYSAEGDVSYNAPSAWAVPSIDVPPVETTEDMFVLPEVDQNIEVPNGTPIPIIIPSLSVPSSTMGVKLDNGTINTPSNTEKVK